MICFWTLSRLTPWTEVGKQTFYRNLPIANPQIIYVCQSTNRKSASFMLNPQITNPQICNEKVCICALAEVLSPQITKKFVSVNFKYEKFHI